MRTRDNAGMLNAGPARLDEAPTAESIDRMSEERLRPPPTRSQWVDRPRLLDVMDRATHLPVTLVTAPAGHGKSTLVAQWLATQHRRVAWVSLDGADNDPRRLWAKLTVALQRAGANASEETLRVDQPGSSVSALSALSRVVGAVASSPADLVIVLDDFEVVRSVDSCAGIDALLSSLPSSVRVILVSRFDPLVRLDRLRAAHRLAEVRADQLAFDVAETTSLLSAMGVQLSTTPATSLVRRTDGWPAAVYLAGLSLAGRADPAVYIDELHRTDFFIAEYLVEEVLSRLPSEVRRFIVDLSVLDRFCAPLAEKVTGQRRAAALLAELQNQNLFLTPLDTVGEWFRFHRLFGILVRSRLEIEQPEQVAFLQARAAEWSDEKDTSAAAADDPRLVSWRG